MLLALAMWAVPVQLAALTLQVVPAVLAQQEVLALRVAPMLPVVLRVLAMLAALARLVVLVALVLQAIQVVQVVRVVRVVRVVPAMLGELALPIRPIPAL